MIDTREEEGARDSARVIHLDSFFLLPHWNIRCLEGSSLVIGIGANPWSLEGMIGNYTGCDDDMGGFAFG